MKLEGIFVATITPFKTNGTLDKDGLKSHLEFLDTAGVHGFVPCATTGESPTLSKEERVAIIQMTKEVAQKRNVPVIAGCGGNSTQHVLELVLEAKELGCDAALVVCPYYNKPSAKAMVSHFTKIANDSKFPLVLYNIPPRTNVNLPPAAIAELLENPYILGVKEASGDYNQWLEISEKANLRDNSLLAGDDNALAGIMSLGGKGTISASANLVPELFVALWESHTMEKWDMAYGIQRRLNPLVRAMFRETNPAPVKYGLKLRCGLSDEVRMPLIKVSSETQEAVRKALSDLEVLS